MEGRMNEDHQQRLNPWFAILARPRETIQQIVDNDPDSNILLLAVLFGISQAIRELEYSAFSNQLLFEVLVEMIVSFATGAIGIYVSSFIMFMTGMWIGGDAPLSHVRAATAWSYIPVAAASFLILPITWIFKGSAQQITGIFRATAAILTLIILLKTLSHVQEFSMCKAVVNTLLAGVIFSVLLILFLIPVTIVIGLFTNV
jgi:hypothetical protein